MFCKKCGNEFEGQFCPKCGSEAEKKSSNQRVDKVFVKKKNLFQKWWFWIIVILVILFVALGSSGSEKKDTTSTENVRIETDAKKQTEKQVTTDAINEAPSKIDEINPPETKENIEDENVLSKADIYENLGLYEEMPYTISPKAKEFIGTHEELFPAESVEAVLEFIDDTIGYKNIAKNQNNYGDKLIKLDEAYVASINESNLDEISSFTELIVMDAEEQVYYIYYFGSLPDIFKDDIIRVFGVPMAMTSYSNVNGGTTISVVLAGSYIEKVQ